MHSLTWWWQDDPWIQEVQQQRISLCATVPVMVGSPPFLSMAKLQNNISNCCANTTEH